MMKSQAPETFFNHSHASEYDRKYAKLSAMRDALHLLIAAVFADLPSRSRILCVGAGTGAEIAALAQRFSHWQFTAVEPSGAMLEECRKKAAGLGIESRCHFHHGFLDTLPPSEPFDAATSLLVSQFIPDLSDRTSFFRDIARRLRPGGWLATADLASDLASSEYRSLLEVWLRLMRETGASQEKLEALRTAYGRDVAVLPPVQVGRVISAGGFEKPVQFLQTGLIHAWFAARAEGSPGGTG
jgi:tRNA (cmo5U34)-methyltransferase